MTVIPSALRALPSGFVNHPPAQFSCPPMLARTRRISPWGFEAGGIVAVEPHATFDGHAVAGEGGSILVGHTPAFGVEVSPNVCTSQAHPPL
ncbi:MAG: hypothetical protein ACRDYX_13745 [Egibacteraceae bacterium]